MHQLLISKSNFYAPQYTKRPVQSQKQIHTEANTINANEWQQLKNTKSRKINAKLEYINNNEMINEFTEIVRQEQYRIINYNSFSKL